jgi:hypothetical protein
MDDERKINSPGFVGTLAETFGLSPTLALIVVSASGLLLAFTIFWFFHSAPPTTITITSGPPGSSFETNAEQYAAILARKGIKLKILTSEGSAENLQRLNDRSQKVDVGFVEVGSSVVVTNSPLLSLGSIAYQPLLIFYRSTNSMTLLSQLGGKRLVIGPVGSGTRTLATTLLQMNGVGTNDTTTLLDLDAADAANALLKGTVDAVFLMGDSASPQIMRRLLLAPNVRLYNFVQADGYTRRITYLNKLEVPMGAIDFGKNIPAQDLYLIGPTVEILARPHLHPALSDLLLEAAREVNGAAKLFQRKGEFPSPVEYDYPISPDAQRFKDSGRQLLYRWLPFWLASLVKRILVSFVPLIVVSIPLLRAIPAVYKWRVRLLLYQRYRALLALERESLTHLSPERRRELVTRLDEIELALHKMKVPASFVDQFYSLRGHIDFVRGRLADGTETTPAATH